MQYQALKIIFLQSAAYLFRTSKNLILRIIYSVTRFLLFGVSSVGEIALLLRLLLEKVLLLTFIQNFNF